ncbi:MAG: DUF2796 domain-containing protein [Chitinophagaceae bacterium]|nr:DUF2796 domain-containing protein [Rubrivivax sp.]
MRSFGLFCAAPVALCVGAADPAVAAGQAHQHGVATLDIAVEPGRISVHFESPLDNLLGFERAPRTDAERARAAAVVARLRAAEQLFRIDPAAGCKLTTVDLQSAPLQLGTASAGADGHADVEASFDFSCQQGQKAGFIETDLFTAFTRLARVEVRVAGAKGQMKAQLRRPGGRVTLVR